jgi:hypothetical protein
MFGGLAEGGGWLNDLWYYAPGTNTWTEKIAVGAAGSPASRYAHSMIWDGIKVIMFAGTNPRNDLWWYNP